MPNEDIWRRIEAHGDRIREHQSAIAVLNERADASAEERKKLWSKKDRLEERLQEVRDEMVRHSTELRKNMSDQHAELMEAITANKTAASILKGERGAGKWIAGFIATVVLVITGLGSLIATVFRAVTGG